MDRLEEIKDKFFPPYIIDINASDIEWLIKQVEKLNEWRSKGDYALDDCLECESKLIEKDKLIVDLKETVHIIRENIAEMITKHPEVIE